MPTKYFITGISKGLGFEIAVLLLQKGNSVIGLSRSCTYKLEILKDNYPKQLFHFLCDISNHEELKKELDKNYSFYENTRVIILNAAAEKQNSATIVETNLKASLTIVEFFAQNIPSAKHFINMNSWMSALPDHINPAYASSKSGLLQLFLSYQAKYPNLQFKSILLGPLKEKHYLFLSKKRTAKNIIRIIFEPGNTSYLTFLNFTLFQMLKSVPFKYQIKILKAIRHA